MRRAFTIVELLVVVFVVGLLVAITLPAVQSAREASRRATCAAHIHELGRALHNYESVFRCFPPAVPALPGYPNLGNSWYSPQVRLLPYVEQAAAFSQVNLAQPVVANISKYLPPVPAQGSPTDARRAVVPVFKCPSDAIGGAAGPVNNYRVCAGAEAHDSQRGTFVILKPRAPADFLDGLSMTVGMSEKLVGAAAPATFSRRRDFWYSGATSLQWTPTADEMIAVCGALALPPTDYYSFAGFSWFYAGFEFTWYNHVVSPNSSIADCAADSASPPNGIRASPVSEGLFQAASDHPGGVNCLMMDGACRFVSDNVDLSVWRAVATVAAGEAMADGASF